MSYPIIPIIGVDLTSTPTTPEFALGTKIVCNDGVYQYVHANGAITAYQMVKIDDDWEAAPGTTTLLPSTEPAKVGVAQTAFADNDYGFVFVGPGLCTVKCAASCVHDVKLYTTGTAGVVDDSATTLVNGLKLIATITTAADSPCSAACELGTVLA